VSTFRRRLQSRSAGVDPHHVLSSAVSRSARSRAARAGPAGSAGGTPGRSRPDGGLAQGTRSRTTTLPGQGRGGRRAPCRPRRGRSGRGRAGDVADGTRRTCGSDHRAHPAVSSPSVSSPSSAPPRQPQLRRRGSRRLLGLVSRGRFVGACLVGHCFVGRGLVGLALVGRGLVGRSFVGRRFVGRRSSSPPSVCSTHSAWLRTEPSAACHSISPVSALATHSPRRTRRAPRGTRRPGHPRPPASRSGCRPAHR
jgi:hypothetical protein